MKSIPLHLHLCSSTTDTVLHLFVSSPFLNVFKYLSPSVALLLGINGSQLGTTRLPGDIWQRLETFLIVTTGGGQRPGTLLNVLQHRALQSEEFPSPTVLTLRNPALCIYIFIPELFKSKLQTLWLFHSKYFSSYLLKNKNPPPYDTTYRWYSTPQCAAHFQISPLPQKNPLLLFFSVQESIKGTKAGMLINILNLK